MPNLVRYCALILGNIWASSRVLNSKIKEGVDGNTPARKVYDFAFGVGQELFKNFPKAKLVAHIFRFMRNSSHNLLYATVHTKDKNGLDKVKEANEFNDRIGSGCICGRNYCRIYSGFFSTGNWVVKRLSKIIYKRRSLKPK